MAEEEKSMEEKEAMVKGMCICADCPSYVDCGEKGGSKELGFCFPTVGKSECIEEEKGCICGSCPVTEKLGLKNGYYCTRGSEKEQNAG